MDDERFDEWTRLITSFAPRRAAVQALAGLFGGLAASLGLSALDDAEAKKKHKHRKRKKKRCKKSLQHCGGKKKCCKALACGDTADLESVCCKLGQADCTDNSECCGSVVEGTGSICQTGRCCRQLFQGCGQDGGDCCTGLVCSIGQCCLPSGSVCAGGIGCCPGHACVNTPAGLRCA